MVVKLLSNRTSPVRFVRACPRAHPSWCLDQHAVQRERRGRLSTSLDTSRFIGASPCCYRSRARGSTGRCHYRWLPPDARRASQRSMRMNAGGDAHPSISSVSSTPRIAYSPGGTMPPESARPFQTCRKTSPCPAPNGYRRRAPSIVCPRSRLQITRPSSSEIRKSAAGFRPMRYRVTDSLPELVTLRTRGTRPPDVARTGTSSVRWISGFCVGRSVRGQRAELLDDVGERTEDER